MRCCHLSKFILCISCGLLIFNCGGKGIKIEKDKIEAVCFFSYDPATSDGLDQEDVHNRWRLVSSEEERKSALNYFHKKYCLTTNEEEINQILKCISQGSKKKARLVVSGKKVNNEIRFLIRSGRTVSSYLDEDEGTLFLSSEVTFQGVDFGEYSISSDAIYLLTQWLDKCKGNK